MTRALVLDFGGDISRTMFETHAHSERALSLPPGTLSWRGPFDPERDALWQDMQAARISERAYWLARTCEVGRLLGEDWDQMQTLVQRTRGAEPDAVARPETLALMREAHAAGHRLAILSNELDLFYGAALGQRMRALRDVEFIVDATHTGILKPDPRAYALCTRLLGLPPADCVFVDDQRRNVEGVHRAGMVAVWFNVADPGTSCDQVRQSLGL